MNSVVSILLLTAALTCAQDDYFESNLLEENTSRSYCNCGAKKQNSYINAGRIMGGTETGINEYPLIAALVFKTKPKFVFCGGTIITDRHVLTAAHCHIARAEDLAVVLAEHDVLTTTESESVTIAITQMINHELYNRMGIEDNDIALLVLASKIPLGVNIEPACFPKANLNIVWQSVRIIGWGDLYFRGENSSVLRKVDVVVRPISDCLREFPYVTSRQLCTYSPLKDSCQRDSGGPVIWLDPATKRYTLVGIVSFGIGCGQSPAVNTNVSAYRDWILRMIQATSPGSSVCETS